MAQSSYKDLYNDYFLQYASYVIRDRAIPDLVDGLKPVQRRILHSLISMDDGKFHKVANVVGETMKYHPHGDSSIYGALVNLANCDLFIEKQGNYGNILTGEPAAAGRYIECRLLPFAKEVLYNPELTTYIDSYDGRAKEPLVFPAKLPVVLIQGAEGIAVGMSTMILPHNPIEVLDAMSSFIKEEDFVLYPDLPTGGIMDVSGYNDGKGKVVIRAKLNTQDPKKVIIEELPYGITSEMMIDSITKAAKSGKLKIASITDYTTDKANIEIDLPRGVNANKNFINALYAYTNCEYKISVNSLVIKDDLPAIMGISEIIAYHARHLMDVLRAEQELRKEHLLEDLYARTLDRIFIEERIYKKIETKKTAEEVERAVLYGFRPFADQLSRKVTKEDVERLLKIPIRRISLFDINKNRQQMEEIQNNITDCEYKLSHLVEYSLRYIEELKKMLTESRKKSGAGIKRRTVVNSFQTVDVKAVAQRNLMLNYNAASGYLGYGVKDGEKLFAVSEYDRILIVTKEGNFQVINVPEKMFVGQGVLWCNLADKDILKNTIFSLIYQTADKKHVCIKRFQVEKFIVDKPYQYLPDGCKFLLLTEKQHGTITLIYRKAPRLRVLEEEFDLDSYLVKGYKASGVRLSSKPIRTLRFTAKTEPSAAAPAAPAPAVPEKNEVEEDPVDSDEGYLLKF